MTVEEKPAVAPFGKVGERNVDYKKEAEGAEGVDNRVGSTNLMIPDAGHFIVVQLAGHRDNPYIENIIGFFYSLAAADMYADKDRGLKVYPVDVLG